MGWSWWPRPAKPIARRSDRRSSTLQRVRANVVGLVLNSVTSNMSDSYRYYGYYGKYYRYYKSAEAGS